MSSRRRLGIAALNPPPEGVKLLDQIGVDWQAFTDSVAAEKAELPLWIVWGEAPSAARLHRRNGGAVLQIGGARRARGLALAGKGEPLFTNLPPVVAYGPLALPASASRGRLLPTAEPILTVDKHFVALPAPPPYRAARLPFAFAGGYAHERVRAFDHAGYRRLVQNALQQLFHELGLPWVRKSNRMNGRRPLLVRIDADNFEPSTSKQAHDLARQTGLPFTWFIDVERHAGPGLDFVAGLAADGVEIHSHGWHHFTYRWTRLDRANIRRAADLLSARGINATGFCAPLGLWSPGLQRAVDGEGLAFSSEFSFAWDDLPRIPPNSRTWQIPVHPICPVLLSEAGAGPAQIEDYYRAYFQRQRSWEEPVTIYFHPLNDLPTTGESIAKLLVELAADHDLVPSTFCRLVDFWKERQKRPLQATFDSSTGAVDLVGGPALITWPDKCQAEAAADSRLDPSAAPGASQSAGELRVPAWSFPLTRRLARREARRWLGAYKRELLTGSYRDLWRFGRCFVKGR